MIHRIDEEIARRGYKGSPYAVAVIGHQRPAPVPVHERPGPVRPVDGVDVFTPHELAVIVGRGGADKTQVQHMVKVLLGIAADMGTDESDALAVALCHAHTRPLTLKLRENAARSSEMLR